MGDMHWKWPILFATMVLLLWIDRNHLVFFGKSAMPDQFLPKVFGQVEAIHSLLLCPATSYIEASYELPIK